eukprot:gnl/MRDRNA2_/MRDRNA2_30207_c0_seq1.p1 gnl/MRDRNA2_/MRDRNA2_30207_c0~~gnl/MRDRNA2_/MRDRNA2_30207_c0_seq1.p1  ORF type:complete len:347 (+),score=80.98 gnl/MRDRNA2_/MRDRNA2_30207_c0_seq1:66-1106(+)
MENLAERISKLEKAKTSASKQMETLEMNLNMDAPPFNPQQPWWPEMDYSQFNMANYAAGYAGMWGWDDPLAILTARVAHLEQFKEEATMHLKMLKERVDALNPVPKAENGKAGFIAPPPGIDIGEADTSASDSDAKGLGISSSDEDSTKEQDMIINANMTKILEDVSEGDEGSDGDNMDDLPPPPPPQPGSISRQTSEMISFTTQPDNSKLISWLITNFRVKMVKQLGRASVSPSIDSDELKDARILISPLGSIDKMPRSRKEKNVYTKTVEQGPFCPYLQLKVPSKQTLTFSFMLGTHSSEKQVHDFSSSPISTQVKIESVDWLKHIAENDLTLTLRIYDCVDKI